MCGVRVLELFCGIGGCAAALDRGDTVVAAVDQNRTALAVYAANFPHPVRPALVESIPDHAWQRWPADLWWMSPPCPPYTRRGLGRDLDDPRARSFLALLDRLGRERPAAVALENVAGFAGSRAHAALREALARGHYDVRETHLCPSELGLPNRRPRFYVVASREGLRDWPARTGPRHALRSLLDARPDPGLWCDPSLPARYPHALDIVDPDDPAAVTACFTAAYGRSPVRSGSYVKTAAGLRRFSPAEILRLLGFPPSFHLPHDLPRRTAWSLVGNSVSVRAVRWVLTAVRQPGQPEPRRVSDPAPGAC
jgi:site-specific DNA-cytosine methylase